MVSVKRSMLLADDEPDLRRLFTRWAKNAQWSVDAVSSAHDLRRRALETEPAVILTDIDLGDGDGVEVCQELLKQRPDLPVVVMTGNPLAAARAEAAGVGIVLRKPFSFAELRSVLAALVPDQAQ